MKKCPEHGWSVLPRTKCPTTDKVSNHGKSVQPRTKCLAQGQFVWSIDEESNFNLEPVITNRTDQQKDCKKESRHQLSRQHESRRNKPVWNESPRTWISPKLNPALPESRQNWIPPFTSSAKSQLHQNWIPPCTNPVLIKSRQKWTPTENESRLRRWIPPKTNPPGITYVLSSDQYPYSKTS